MDMLYKVTPMMAPPAPEKAKSREPGQPRKKRKSAVYDGEGHEVLISLMCLKCRTLRPLAQFGLRKMADGAIRNQPWCRGCRSGAGTKKPKDKAAEAPQTPASVAGESTAPLQVLVAEDEFPRELPEDPSPEPLPDGEFPRELPEDESEPAPAPSGG
jgi:hypothetical protein